MAALFMAFDTIWTNVFLDLSLGLKIEICFHDEQIKALELTARFSLVGFGPLLSL